MIHNDDTIWQSTITKQFADALVAIGDKNSMQNFLRDAMTKKEIEEISMRFEAARRLVNGDKYADISRKTQLSSRTVARISDWLQHGCNGYEKALKAINKYHKTTSPG